jgi:hypothetical protein
MLWRSWSSPIKISRAINQIKNKNQTACGHPILKNLELITGILYGGTPALIVAGGRDGSIDEVGWYGLIGPLAFDMKMIHINLCSRRLCHRIPSFLKRSNHRSLLSL